MKLALACLLLSSAAYADGLQYVPKWHMMGDEACYSFADAKTLVTLDSKLTLCAQEEATQPKLIGDLQLTVADLKTAFADMTKDRDQWKKQAWDLDDSLHKCNVDKANAQASNSGYFGWVVAGAVVLVGGGLVGGYYLFH